MKEIIDASKAIIELLLPTVKDMELIREYGFFAWTYVFIIKLFAWIVVYHTIKAPIKFVGKKILKQFKKWKKRKKKKK